MHKRTERQLDRQTESQTWQTETEKQTDRPADTQTEIKTDRQKRLTIRQTNRTDRLAGRQYLIEKQTGRQTNRRTS
jgi:hypothetical protein